MTNDSPPSDYDAASGCRIAKKGTQVSHTTSHAACVYQICNFFRSEQKSQHSNPPVLSAEAFDASMACPAAPGFKVPQAFQPAVSRVCGVRKPASASGPFRANAKWTTKTP